MNKALLTQGTRVALDMTTLTIMRRLPREVTPQVYEMSTEDPGSVSFEEIGGLAEQVQELREVIELPLTNPELFQRVGVKPPKGVLLYGIAILILIHVYVYCVQDHRGRVRRCWRGLSRPSSTSTS